MVMCNVYVKKCAFFCILLLLKYISLCIYLNSCLSSFAHYMVFSRKIKMCYLFIYFCL